MAGSTTAVLGVADHSGWAVCVTVAAIRGVPVIVDRRRVELIEPGIPSQPYHHDTVRIPLPEGERLVARVRASVMRTTLTRLSELRDELQPQCRIVAMTLRMPPMTWVPVTVAEAHSSYYVMCRADGMMYHDALRTAAGRLRMEVELEDRGEEIVRAAERLGVTVRRLEQFVASAGRSVGPPWRKEHRLAVAAAVNALAARARVALPSALDT